MNLSVNQPMKQRINLSIELEPMALSQTMEYINHQLDISKARNQIFDDKCYPVIHSISSGIPRKINQLCYRALLEGYIDKKTIITEDYVRMLADKSANIFSGKAID
jgi:type II secretory pathway predicted ATPase ExeA